MNKLFFAIFFFITSLSLFAKTTRYHLNITKGDITVAGKVYKDKIMVNGGIPAPELTFTYGDMAEIRVTNQTDEETLIHWHGILIKNDQDGVPYVNSPPIAPYSEKIYRFKIKQTGTYWYHSHVMFQEEDGMYGAFTILPKEKKDEVPERTIILSDLTSESGEEIQRNVKKEGEYYDVKKKTVQSWLEAFKSGNALTKWRNSLQRMEGMDYADIAYEHFTANGEPIIELFNNLEDFNDSRDSKVKLRIINGSATSIYKLTYAGEYITVVGADGLPVEPVQVKILPISVAETYDILVNLKRGKKLELRATSIDNSGFSSIWLGTGETKLKAPSMPWQHPISMSMGQMMGMKDMSFFKELAMNYRNEFSDIPEPISYMISKNYSLPNHKILMPMMSMKSSSKTKAPEESFRIMNRTMKSIKQNKLGEANGNTLYNELTYGLLKAKEPIEIKSQKKLRTIKFSLNGNMKYYIWSINGIPVGPDTYIKIRKGERVRFIMKNTTMMNHPMHLHGHFFRVMTNQGRWSVLKHTVNVAPLGQTVIEFEASEEKDWFFHCHILYHMMAGMTRIIRYENDPGPQEFEDARRDSKEFQLPSSFFLRSKNLVQTNYYRTETTIFNSYYNFMFDIVGNYDEDLEGELHISRILTRYLSPYLGVKTEAEGWNFKTTPTLGFTWVLPLNISMDFKLQPLLDKDFELEFESEIQLTSKLQFNYEYSSERNFYSELEYRQTKNLSFVGSYNKTYEKWGLGLGYTY